MSNVYLYSMDTAENLANRLGIGREKERSWLQVSERDLGFIEPL